ncbi:MAG: tetratricopeptide repeat protein [Acidobacteriota bacterium]
MRKILVFGALAVMFALLMQRPLQAGDKEEIIKLKEQILVLQTDIRNLKESSDKNSGQLTALFGQVVDGISIARRDVTQTRDIVDRSLGSVTEAANNTTSQLSRLNERLNATDQRLEKLEVQLKKIEGFFIPREITSNCDNGEQQFAQAYSDYLRGNYALAIAQFQNYVRCFSQTEKAGNAQYLIGDAYYKQLDYKSAAGEFDKLVREYNSNNKVATAHYKKADSLLKLGQRKEAEIDLKLVVQNYPGTLEAKMAQEALNQLPPEPIKPTRPHR